MMDYTWSINILTITVAILSFLIMFLIGYHVIDYISFRVSTRKMIDKKVQDFKIELNKQLNDQLNAALATIRNQIKEDILKKTYNEVANLYRVTAVTFQNIEHYEMSLKLVLYAIETFLFNKEDQLAEDFAKVVIENKWFQSATFELKDKKEFLDAIYSKEFCSCSSEYINHLKMFVINL